ncbi:hypothetical protein GYMLUDRAFT_229412 [Collybiopsis luxurians FD-317 M1]|uniref:Unplaced genomic scaffold GYMLUscaffold_44, whole genome shotgun sequence n=1 Tax=Collybiopsis luxurians FD-317 M1 TaxID=944289 RepID=A0A0D0B1V5_9AGAR|nr:hypothetical protein GYMLUDRAFT_229412 [Collybiopsis luxurians FD-317 M1]
MANASVQELTNLISVCQAAPFGCGTETILDESYPKALKLDLSQFSTPFDLAGTRILHQIQQDLVNTHPGLRHRIRAERYKNIYNAGSYSKPHKDIPRAPNMFGSLVINFPTFHKGGDLLLTANGQRWIFNSANLLSKSTPTEPRVSFVSFYNGVTQEVLPVVSGARITLTYNLYLGTSSIFLTPNPLVSERFVEVKRAMAKLLEDPKYSNAPLLAFGLAHCYPIARDGQKDYYKLNELSHYLKGGDALLFRACWELGLNPVMRLYYENEDGLDDDREFFADRICYPSDNDPNISEDDHPERQHYFGMEWIDDENPCIWVIPIGGESGVQSSYLKDSNEYPEIGNFYGEICFVCRR